MRVHPKAKYSPMRITHLPSDYFPDSVGGTESYVASLVQDLDGLGQENVVLVHRDEVQPLAAPGVSLPPYQARATTSLYACSDSASDGHAEPPGFRSFLLDWQTDIVHLHAKTLGAGVDHVAISKQLGIPVVITYHTPSQSCPRGTLLERGRAVCDGQVAARRCTRCVLTGTGVLGSLAPLLAVSPLASPPLRGRLATALARPSLIRRSQRSIQQFFGMADAIVACAEFCADVLAVNGVDRAKISVVRQGLQGESRDRELRRLSTCDGQPVRIGYFGRINRDKGVDLLIDAVSALAGEGQSIRVEYAGPVERDLESTIARLDGIAQRHLGLLRGQELKDWIRGLDLVVVPSRWLETGPLTLLEAWDQGTPVLGADAAGIRDFMVSNEQQHMMFERDSATALKAALKSWIRSESAQGGTVHIPGMRSVAAVHERLYSELSPS